MIEKLIHQQESKTLEFKRDASSMQKILQTIVAFANTAGGTIVIGMDNDSRKIVGLQDVLLEEERIASTVADSISPQMLPRIEIHNYRNKELIVIQIACAPGPFYITRKGPKNGVYVRLGSTNRVADNATLMELERLRANVTFDSLPCLDQSEKDIDWEHIQQLFKVHRNRKVALQKSKSLGLLASHMGKRYPSNAAVLMFGYNRDVFPDAVVRCARFHGEDREFIADQEEFCMYLTDVVESTVDFVRKHIKTSAEIGPVRRKNIPDYPHTVIREAVQNAVLHADYSIPGCTIQVAIFDTRIEITNPGGFVQGMTLDLAKTGVSVLRNRVIGRIFKELDLIEQWGSGIKRIINTCAREGLKKPSFEELNNQFRVTLYSRDFKVPKSEAWEEPLITYLKVHKTVKPKDAAKLWDVSDRTSRKRLNTLASQGTLKRISTSEKDPLLRYVLSSELD